MTNQVGMHLILFVTTNAFLNERNAGDFICPVKVFKAKNRRKNVENIPDVWSAGIPSEDRIKARMNIVRMANDVLFLLYI